MKKCSFCGRRPIIHQRYSGIYLCDRCFRESVERRFRRIVSKYELVSSGDRIAVAVSGGPDSLTCLYLVADYCDSRKVDLFALTIDEGIKNYREKSIHQVRDLSSRLKLDHVVFGFEEAFGASLDQMANIAEDSGLNPCTCCGVLRRSLLNEVARECKANKIAIAHNLDDGVQTIVMNYIRADLSSLKRMRPILPNREGFVPRIKPLWEIPEKEVALYALLRELEPHIATCPYVEGMRTEVRRFINKLEFNHPTTKYKILRTFEKINPHLPSDLGEPSLKECEICGEPSVKDTCRRCELLGQLGLKRGRSSSYRIDGFQCP